MGTTADKLAYLNGTKTAIKNAIVAKGVDVPDGTTFRAYVDKIASIQDVSSLPTQGAKTVTPTTTEQIAVAPGTYTTGDIKVAGDANLVAENIAEGVSIFGVVGTHSGGGKTELVNVSFDSFRKSGELIYINGDGSYYIASNAGGAVNLSVLKNSIVYLNGSSYTSSGAVEKISGTNAYFVSGDCTLSTY